MKSHLPDTPAEARAIPLASLGIDAAREAVAGGANDSASRRMGKLIHEFGRKYTAEARAWALAYSCGEAQ